jgi:dTDP-4-amino-4,6-dideoxygalactose transaminase
MCVTPATIAARITKRTKAVIVVHYGGYAIDVHALRVDLPSNIAIIEDAAHAMGARYPSGENVGSSGNSVCFSFYANKNLSTADGGAIALTDKSKAERLRSLRLNGMNSNAWSRYINPASVINEGLTELGYKMNLTDLQAAIGRVQLRRFADMQKVRLNVAKHYKKRIDEMGLNISFQSSVFDENHARHLFVGLFERGKTGIDRDQLLWLLRQSNVGASIHYRPLHQQPLYIKSGVFSLPNTEKLANSILTLPISARMSLADVDYVVEQLTKVMLNHRGLL